MVESRVLLTANVRTLIDVLEETKILRSTPTLERYASWICINTVLTVIPITTIAGSCTVRSAVPR